MDGTTINAEYYANLDRMIHAWQGRFMLGLSPAAMWLAYYDWLIHLSTSPGKQAELLENIYQKNARLAMYAGEAMAGKAEPVIKPLKQDTRFNGEAWQKWPYNLYYQSFLTVEQWWHYATTGIPGVENHHEQMVSFTARQILDMISPSNYLATNPEIMQTTVTEGGKNLVKGFENYKQDLEHIMKGQRPVGAEKFLPGKNVAVTPGKVVFRNRLIELIQYSPVTEEVQAEPILIVPAWIMKYYILDLSPENSLVKYLVGQGHTVFMISWKNPGKEDRDLSMEDYRTLGAISALDVISAIIPNRKIHAVGYCIGGTLLTITAAAMARDGDDRLKTVTLFTTQTDFTEAGELMLFIDEDQLEFLENITWSQGYLDTKQMAGAFQLLRSIDLVWSRLTKEYLQGHREELNDLMSWNADGTRLPHRMHSEYMRSLFLHNDLFEGRYRVKDKPISISDIKIPIYVVATVKDHVAPWRSVYKINLMEDTEITFVLAGGGHNAGIVSEPGHANRSYQVSTSKSDEKYVDPDTWLIHTPVTKGSWWDNWVQWMVAHSSGKTQPPRLGGPGYLFAPICDAPGTYVLQS